MKPLLMLPSRRAITYAAITYLIVIISITIPRVIGPSWRSIMSPRDMRNLEGFPVQWEAFLVLRSLHAMSTNAVPDDLLTWFSTDEYRAILPIYFAAIISQLSRSYVISITASEVTWWWLGAIGVFLFTRNFTSLSNAYFAGLLTCFSPLGVGHIGSAHLHTASSLSLSVFLAITWRLFFNIKYSLFSASLLFGCCLYISSITYTYQWFLICFYLLISLFSINIKRNTTLWVSGTVIFLLIRLASYGLLGIGDLYVHSHQNDPIRVLFSRVDNLLINIDSVEIFSSLLLDKLFVIFHLYDSSYGSATLFIAALGAVFLRDKRESLALFSGAALSVSFGAIYGIPWVIMCGYPMVYTLASLGISRVHHYALATIPLEPLSVLRLPLPTFLTQLFIIIIIGLSTNLDIFGDPTFTIVWWQGWYEPH